MTNRKNTFLLKRSNVPGKVPSPGDLQLGELALNTADVILYASGTTTNQILPIGWDRLSTLSGGTVYGPTIFTNGLTANTLTVQGLTQTSGVTSTGGIIFPQKTINSTYTAQTEDYTIDASGGTFTVYLPTAVGIQGKLYNVKNNGGGAVTVQPFGSETIDDKPFVILGETNALQLVSNGSGWVALGYNVSTVNSSTGVFEFTGITTASTTTFYVSPVKGWIVDDTTNPLSPQIYYLSYSGGVNTDNFVNTSNETFVFLNSGGIISQQSTPLTEQQRRQNIFLGKLSHPDKTSIYSVFSQPDFVLSPLGQLRDMFTPINLINGGILPSTNGANLKFNTSAGYLYGLGINFANNTLSPNTIYVTGENPRTFQYRTQTGATLTDVTDIDPLNYDLGGVITPITGTKATNQRIYLQQDGSVVVMYGQQNYNTLALAISSIQNESFISFPNLSTDAVLIGVLSVLSTATDLTDTTKAKFFFASKFGETIGAAGGTAVTNLQQAYNNSTSPEITTNSILGGVQFKGGTGNDNDKNIIVENNAGVETAWVTASGNSKFNSLSATSVYTNYIDFNTGATVTQSVGRVSWDSGTGTLNVAVGDDGTGLIDLQVGQEEIVRVFNDEATTLVKGEIVYVSGSNGNRPRVKRAVAISDGYSVTTLGMVSRNIASGDEGYVTTFGIISNLNTLGLSGGTPIWLSGTVPGAYTSTKPIAPEHIVLIGYVVRVSATVGSVFVNISNGWELDELHDVRISGVTEGDLLIRSSYSGTPVWINSKTLKGNYTFSGNTNQIGNFNITGNTNQIGNFTITGNTFQSGNTSQKGNFNITGNTSQIGNFNIIGNTNQVGDVILSGYSYQIGNNNLFGDFNVTGNTNQDGNFYINGLIEQIGDVYQVGNVFLTGYTEQIGDVYLVGNTEQIGNLYLTGDTEQIGDVSQVGDVYLTGNTTQIGNFNINGNTEQIGNFNITGNTIIDGSLSADTITITNTPLLNNTLFQILGRNETTGDVEYRQVNTIGNNVTILTGGTYSAQTTIDNVIGVDTTLISTTIYLPDSVSSGRLRFEIKDVGLNAYNNPITIIASGTDTIISYTNSQTLIMESEGGAIILFNTGLGQWWQM